MNGSMNGWSELHRMGWSVLLAAFALGCGMTLATAQQGQEVPKTTAKSAASAGTGAASSWVKVCTKDDKTGNKQVCLVRYEGLEPKTGAILIAAAVRTIEGEDKQHLLVNVSTAYSLAMSPAFRSRSTRANRHSCNMPSAFRRAVRSKWTCPRSSSTRCARASS